MKIPETFLSSDNKFLHIFFVISSLSLCILFLCGVYPMKSSVIIDHCISASLFLGATLVFFRKTYLIGWLIIGGLICIISYGTILFWQFTSCESKGIAFLFLLYIIYCFVYFCFHNKNKYELFIEARNKIKKSEVQIEKIIETENQINLDLKESNNELNVLKTNQTKLERENTELTKTNKMQSEPIKAKYKRLYESQLTALFSTKLANEWNGIGEYGLHFYQGNLDDKLADFIGNTNNTFWLMELKRSADEIPTEIKKKNRIVQLELLEMEDNRDYRNIADTCHWLGWGCNNDDIFFASYWQTIQSKQIQEIKLDEFVYRSFSDSSTIGTNESQFFKYINFLLNALGKTEFSDEDYPIIIYRKNSSGQLLAVKTTLFKTHIAYLKHQQNLQIERNKQNKPRGYDSSLSR